MFMLVVHVVALYLIAAAIGVVAWVLWTKQVSVTLPPPPNVSIEPANITVMPAAVHPHIVVQPAPVHQVWQQGGTHSSANPPETLVELLKSGKHLGWRTGDHPDIEEAIATPGLSVRYPDGTVVGAE